MTPDDRTEARWTRWPWPLLVVALIAATSCLLLAAVLRIDFVVLVLVLLGVVAAFGAALYLLTSVRRKR